MSKRRSFMAGQRSRDNENGGMALVTYNLEKRRAAYRNRWQPYNAHKTIAKILTGKRLPRKM